MKNQIFKILIAAGGTGGHLFPALAIVEQLQEMEINFKYLFIGSKNKIESRIVPDLGFEFETISMIGMPRKISFKFLKFLFFFKIACIQSFFKILKFKPDLVIGTGGYISVPPLLISKLFGKKILIIEPNSYPGIAIKLLSKMAFKVYLSFDQTAKYLKRKDNIIFSGTPVRKNLALGNKEEAFNYFNLSPNRKTILILGGSLGARSINEKIASNLDSLLQKYNIIWQCGKYYIDELKNKFSSPYLYLTAFLEKMDLAYCISDLLISRSGASTLSEITNFGLASILIPSPNVAENHQYHNASSLSSRDAAILFEDDKKPELLGEIIDRTISDENKISTIRFNAKKMSKPEAAKQISKDVINILGIKYE